MWRGLVLNWRKGAVAQECLESEGFQTFFPKLQRRRQGHRGFRTRRSAADQQKR
jgi:hypothetical protein